MFSNVALTAGPQRDAESCSGWRASGRSGQSDPSEDSSVHSDTEYDLDNQYYLKRLYNAAFTTLLLTIDFKVAAYWRFPVSPVFSISVFLIACVCAGSHLGRWYAAP